MDIRAILSLILAKRLGSAAVLCVVAFLSVVVGAVVFAVPTLEEGQTFYFESSSSAAAVRYQGSLTGQQPKSNSGVNYFDMAGWQVAVDPAYQLRATAPQTSEPFALEGFAWNDNWGWISFFCDGADNLGQPCAGTYGVSIDVLNNGKAGVLTGTAWNPHIGTIYFDRADWPSCNPFQGCSSMTYDLNRVHIGFEGQTSLFYPLEGQFEGFGWNNSVGWMHFQGTIDPVPQITGFTCGNGVFEGDEQCDDGNTLNGDNCQADCTLPQCGDGIFDAGEQCEDGNTAPGDGCGSTCQNEPIVDGDPFVPSCGDEILQTGESCDDGIIGDQELDSVDDGACVIDLGDWACQPNECGDGYFQSGVEQCDDGNLANNDGCTSTCTREPPTTICGNGIYQPAGGEECDQGAANSWNGACLPSCTTPVCGDGFWRTGTEQCDDGNANNNDGCRNNCTLPPGPPPAFICGNGVTRGASEQCDDGNTTSGDGCDSNCQVEGVCGDDVLNPYTEECDDGNLYSGDGCTGRCIDEGPGAVCGNGFRERFFGGGAEQCDDGNAASGDGCSSACQIEVEYCGDGITNGTEECDDGNSNNTDVCANDCTFGVYSVCGDGEVTLGEDCDDGNTLDGDSCSSVCLDDPFTEVPGLCTAASDCEDVAGIFTRVFGFTVDSSMICDESCGDGYLQETEECDDGNNTSGDGCSVTCTDETAGAVCGNGIEEIGEGCDDGGNESGDGCDAYCEDEDTFICYDNPTCEGAFAILGDVLGVEVDVEGYCNTESYCGDGLWDVGEECDWDDASDPYVDYCSFTCEYEYDGFCGDGVQDAGEECDDGNYQNSDGCDKWCDYEFEEGTCGDGNWNLGEECDESYLQMGDYMPAWNTTCDIECNITPSTCGNGTHDVSEECDDGPGPSGNGTPTSNCDVSCNLIPTPQPITCFPEADVVKVSDSTRGDVYRLYVEPNCIEREPSSPDYWNVRVLNDPAFFNTTNTVDCNQTDAGNDRNCTFTSTYTRQFADAPTAQPPFNVAEVYSIAPTGYSGALDDDNTYVLNQMRLQILDGATSAILFDEWVPVNYRMDFSPKVEVTNLKVSAMLTTSWQNYFSYAYGTNIKFTTSFYVNSLVSGTVPAISGIYQLAVEAGSAGYQFLFDTNTAAPAGVQYGSGDTPDKTYNSSGSSYARGASVLPSPSYSLIPIAAVVGPSGNQGAPEGESLYLKLTYKSRATLCAPAASCPIVTYYADHIPDATDFKQIVSEAQISGPINTDKIEGTDVTLVGAVSEGTKRKSLMENLTQSIMRSDIMSSGRTSLNISGQNVVVGAGAEFLTETIENTSLYYFKDDLVISNPSGPDNMVNRTIVVEGGNIFINSNIDNGLLTPNGPEAELELVALKNVQGRGGHIFIGPNVTYLEAHIFADGAVLPYDGVSFGGEVPDWQDLADGGFLDNQLIFKGSFTSNNTIGGAEGTCISLNPCYKGDGTITTIQNSAKIYDFNFFRQFGLVPGSTDSAGNPEDCDGDGGAPEISGLNIIEDPVCSVGGDADETSDLVPLGDQWEDAEDDQNYPMYIEFESPLATSPVFGN